MYSVMSIENARDNGLNKNARETEKGGMIRLGYALELCLHWLRGYAILLQFLA
jgi:hypothetical protein